MCENLSISGIYTAGIPDHMIKTLILDIEFNENYFERVIHHEVFHIIFDSNKKIFNEDKWIRFNDKKFKYAKCSTCSEKLGLNTYENTSGFFTEYSKTTASEDMAEVFSHLMSKITTNNDDPIIDLKKKFIKENIMKIDNTFKF